MIEIPPGLIPYSESGERLLPGQLAPGKIIWRREGEEKMKMTPRIASGDFLYMGFWLVFLGGFIGAVLVLLIRIESNTRR